MADQKPEELSATPSLLAPFASADRGYIETHHGKIDFSRRTAIMGIINVTPDSFYDGGQRLEASRAIADGVAMVEAGAEILDVGGESTRPGARPVSQDEELARVLPVVSGLRREVQVPISIDTYKSGVARRTLDAGADIVNDISALRFDPAMVSLVADEKIPIVLMHMQGKPQTMQAEPRYNDVVREVRDFLAAQLYEAMDGVSPGADHPRSRHRSQDLEHICSCSAIARARGLDKRSHRRLAQAFIANSTGPDQRMEGAWRRRCRGSRRRKRVLCTTWRRLQSRG